MKNFEEFITDLKNCKDIPELLKCLSSKGAFDFYTIQLIKRDHTQEGFNEHFAKQIKLSDFLTQWIDDNNGFFMYDDIKYLIDLIRATHNYLSLKDNKAFYAVIQKTEKKQRLNSAKKYQVSVKKHLQAVKRDLEEIYPQGGKTQSLLNSIDEALNNMDSIVPIVTTIKANTKELDTYLTNLEHETGISKEATREYKMFFQSYTNLKFSKNFRFTPALTHITT